MPIFTGAGTAMATPMNADGSINFDALEKMTDEINKIQEHLRDLKAIGKVKVEGDVYAGVKIYIRDVLDEVKIDTKSVTFFYDKAFSKRGPYEPPSLAEEQPDGYSAD